VHHCGRLAVVEHRLWKAITIVTTGNVLPNALGGQIQLPRKCASRGLRRGHCINKCIGFPKWFLRPKKLYLDARRHPFCAKLNCIHGRAELSLPRILDWI
jgi:hypothetical protein